MVTKEEETLNAVAGKQNREEGTDRSSNPFQEEGVTMTTRVAVPAEKFDTTINVGNRTVFAADNSVWVHAELGALEFTPEQACAFAAALQAVAVHVMEQQSEVAI